MICDFCSAPEPLVEIPCRSFQISEHGWGSKGNFMVCGICAALIADNDREGLFSYVVRIYTVKYPEMMHPYARRAIRQMQDLFWQHCTVLKQEKVK